MANSGWTNDALETLLVGDIPGQHFIINNPATGDILDVYDSANRLVMKIDAAGALTAIDQPAQDTVVLAGNSIGFGSVTAPPPLQASIIGLSNTNGLGSSLQLDSGSSISSAFGGDSLITLCDLNFPGAGGSSAIKVDQRLTNTSLGVEGTLVQTDSFGTGNNVMHAAVYSGTVAGGDGHWIFAHNCNFVPQVVELTPYAAGGGDGPGYVRMFTTAVDGTFCYTIWRDDGGGVTANGTTVGVHAVFYG
jgi:hypothetical protein